MDFGGAFGSTYQQNKDLFPNDIKWTVVEQEHFVKYGKEHFTDEHLSFEYTIDNVTSKTCVLCSGSLQYIMNYKEYLDLMIKQGFMYIIIERTSVSDKEWIMIQNVQEPIYDASYPLYVFKEDEFIKHFTSKNYRLIDFILNRRNHGSVGAGRGKLNLHNFLPARRMSVQGIRDFCTSLLTKTFHPVVKSSGFDIILQAPFMIGKTAGTTFHD